MKADGPAQKSGTGFDSTNILISDEHLAPWGPEHVKSRRVGPTLRRLALLWGGRAVHGGQPLGVPAEPQPGACPAPGCVQPPEDTGQGGHRDPQGGCHLPELEGPPFLGESPGPRESLSSGSHLRRGQAAEA